MRISSNLLVTVIMFSGINCRQPALAAPPVRPEFTELSQQFFEAHCLSCHGVEDPEGDVSLQDIGEDFQLPEVSQRWLAVLRQLESGAMPPAEAKQPGHAGRQKMIAGIGEQFRLVGRPLELIRSAPKYGNYVNHAELFSGENKGPAFSRPRIWRISPYIDGQSSPFSLSQEEGFKDYAPTRGSCLFRGAPRMLTATSPESTFRKTSSLTRQFGALLFS